MTLQIERIEARHAHRLHRVRMLEPGLCRVMHGTKHVFVGEQHLPVHAGQWVLLPAHVAFDVANEPDARGYLAQVLTVPRSMLTEFHQLHGADCPPASALARLQDWRIDRDPRLDRAWDLLAQHLKEAAPAALLKHHLHGVLLVLGLAGQLHPLLNHRDGGLSLRVQHLLMSDAAAPWTQEDVAARFHMSAPTLRRHLASEGQSFREILDSVRMAHALSHLQTTRRSIGEIALACGYASASRFAARFRQRFGLSPRALRSAI